MACEKQRHERSRASAPALDVENPMHLRRTTSLLVLAALVAVAPLARAADDKDKAQAREHYRRGSKAFDLQRYDEAAAEYSKVY